MSYHDVESNLLQQIHVILTEICSVHNYSPQMRGCSKVCEGYVFTGVSGLSVHGGCQPLVPGGGGGVSATPPWSDTPPGQTPPRQTIPQVDTPSPPVDAGIQSTSGRYASH